MKLPEGTGNVVSLPQTENSISIEDEMHLHYKDDEVAIRFLELMRKQKSRYVYPQCHRLRGMQKFYSDEEIHIGTAFVLIFPSRWHGRAANEVCGQSRNDSEKYIILPYFWIPEDNLKKRVNHDHVPYDVWKAQGHIRTTPGNVVDYRWIEEDIKRIASEFVIKEIAYDRYNATQIILNLMDEGLTMIPFGQGFKDMSPPTKELFTLVLKNKIIHNMHPVLRWSFDNVCVETDAAENIKPSKKKSAERIDGAVAAIMGLDRAVRNMNANTSSVYDERGIVVL